jgi:hypothetical protein
MSNLILGKFELEYLYFSTLPSKKTQQCGTKEIGWRSNRDLRKRGSQITGYFWPFEPHQSIAPMESLESAD